MNFIKHRMTRKGVINKVTGVMQRYSAYCQNVASIFDVGANVGIYSLLFTKYFPEASVIAFEPVQKNFTHLQQHINMNKLNNRVKIEQQGLWSSKAQMNLGIPKDRDDIENTGLYSVYGSKIQVTGSFDTMDEWSHLNPDLIKIDAEGAELEILRGASQCLSKARYLIIAKHQDHLDHPEGYLDIFARYGFEQKPKLRRKEDIFLEKIKVV
ncbi:hypothetical protein LCGC14_1592940 [marine sediment metagenome]|uniref:Methyltransferase FkbM domain-containing protein n=1 Tax=marine sediment metagenome TaxID=412755 RepID=A0A0F9LDX7_9ZZZZ